MGNYLNKINSPDDLKNLKNDEYEDLAKEIREFLIHQVSNTGGHLASNLGVVELTMSLHKIFSTPKDKIIWDVGHQSYVHKIITGRKECFVKLRKIDGISGFPKVNESCHDCFNTGHSSTSISAALGIAKARDIKSENYSVIAVIGDGALTGGMSFEALNDAGRSNNNLIVILNDNQMSIAKNVGGVSKYLSNIRTQPIYFKVKEDIDFILNKIPSIGKKAAKVLDKAKGSIKYMVMPGTLFEEMGFTYIGPIDGHDINDLNSVLSRAKNTKGPVLVHVLTDKGKGYQHAEERPHKFHGVAPFEIKTGEAKISGGSNYSKVFGEEIVKLAKNNKNIVAITAAMPDGTGLGNFSKEFPERFFDVGIAEQHAMTFSAGLSRNGIIPVVAIYSSFLQRAYDQILHDVATQNLHVVICIDRAGIVGDDGETHQGVYDVSFLSHIPNMKVLAPCDYSELKRMLNYAILEQNGPIAIRYPRGAGKEKLVNQSEDVKKATVISEGKDITLISLGSMLEFVLEAEKSLKLSGISVEVINARSIKPLDKETIIKSIRKTKNFITIEDNVVRGGFGSYVLELCSKERLKVDSLLMGFKDEFVNHGSRNQLFEKHKLDANSIVENALELVKKGRRFTVEKGKARHTSG
ncbi:MAG: 1-deoxy-D-xylulose-5-phosphate synthase [Clostridiales bacterium]